jgi:uncharacterized protein YoaH (UPF0181 family)
VGRQKGKAVAEQIMSGELSVAAAMEIVAKDEIRKQKKRDSLKKWRTEHKSEYNEYIKQWRRDRTAAVNAAKAILAANAAK